jgi:hypothetical protein
MPRIKIASVLSAVCSALLLTACAGNTPQERLVVQDRYLHPQIPPGLLQCQLDPEVPEALTEAAVADYLLALWAAGEDCRQKLGQVSGLLAHAP